MLRPVRGLLAFSLALTVFACDSGDPDEPDGGAPPTPTTVAYGETVVTAAARAFSAAEAAAVTEVSEDRSRVVVTTAAFGADPIAVGDVIVAGPSGAVPDGLLRRVTAVAADGASTVLTTAAASLEDVVVEGIVTASIDLDPTDIVEVTPLQAGVSAGEPGEGLQLDGVLVDLDGDAATSDDIVRLDGSISLDPAADVALEWSSGVASRVAVDVWVDLAVDLDAVWEGQAEQDVRVRVADYRYRPVALPLGSSPLLILLTPTLGVDVVLSGSATDALQLTAGYSVDAATRIEATSTQALTPTATGEWAPLGAGVTPVAPVFSSVLDPEVRSEAAFGIGLFGEPLALTTISTTHALDLDPYRWRDGEAWWKMQASGSVRTELTTLALGTGVSPQPSTPRSLSGLELGQSEGTIPVPVPPRISDFHIWLHTPYSQNVNECIWGEPEWRAELTFEDPNGDAYFGDSDVMHRWRNDGGPPSTQVLPYLYGSTGTYEGTFRVTLCTNFSGVNQTTDEVWYVDELGLPSNTFSFSRPL